MMVSSPHLPTVLNVCELLAQQTPDAAGRMMTSILEAIAEGLQRNGWSEPEAHQFALRFGHSVNFVMRLARDHATVH